MPQNIGGINLFVLISAISLLFCVPLALVMESAQWGAAFSAAQVNIGTEVSGCEAPSELASEKCLRQDGRLAGDIAARLHGIRAQARPPRCAIHASVFDHRAC